MTLNLLVVDDSALMRWSLQKAFEATGEFTVRQARDGQDALAQVLADPPDVVTLDIDMPVMDGLTCLRHIMAECPVPVVMVSSETEKDAEAVFEALNLGAVDYVSRVDSPLSMSMTGVLPYLIDKVRAAIRTRPESPTDGSIRPAREADGRAGSLVGVGPVPGVVLVGASTGGPRTLEGILRGLPADFPYPVVVAQHMPDRFTRVFADRMDARCSVDVVEVSGGEPLRPGCVYIGKGGMDVVIERRLGRLGTTSVAADSAPWHPSVGRLVRSALEVLCPSQIIAVQLTGMGDDGATEMAELYYSGGYTVAESERTSVVFGMPRALIDRGGASVVLDAPEIADHLTARLVSVASSPRILSTV